MPLAFERRFAPATVARPIAASYGNVADYVWLAARPAARIEPVGGAWKLHGRKNMVVAADRASAVLLSASIDDELV